MGGARGGFAPSNIHCAPTSGGTLSKAHYEHCNTSPACAVLTELRDRNCVKAIVNYDGLPSTSKETKVLAPLMPMAIFWSKSLTSKEVFNGNLDIFKIHLLYMYVVQ